MNRFERLLTRLDLKSPGPGVFLGGAGAGGIGGEARLFGGLVAAQAAMAAQLACPEFPMHSLHAYFLRPGRAEKDIEFHVRITKQGRNFHNCLVDALQSDEPIFQLIASFHRLHDGVQHQDEAPETSAPENHPNRDQLRGRSYWEDMPIDVRMVDEITGADPLPPEQRVWLKANGNPGEDPKLHLALVVYASDRSLLDTAWRPHAGQGDLAGASLDHSMWFHAPPRFDEWLLYHMRSPAAAAGRGLAHGAMYNLAGKRILSVAQEGMLSLRS
ncbi:MAG: acyl-CoA thioesterase domain-containing protein [Pseudomonadota bacterium]